MSTIEINAVKPIELIKPFEHPPSGVCEVKTLIAVLVTICAPMETFVEMPVFQRVSRLF